MAACEVAGPADVPGILEMLAPLEQAGVLTPRPADLLTRDVLRGLSSNRPPPGGKERAR